MHGLLALSLSDSSDANKRAHHLQTDRNFCVYEGRDSGCCLKTYQALPLESPLHSQVATPWATDRSAPCLPRIRPLRVVLALHFSSSAVLCSWPLKFIVREHSTSHLHSAQQCTQQPMTGVPILPVAWSPVVLQTLLLSICSIQPGGGRWWLQLLA